MLKGGYFFQELPCVPGNEGSGTVVAYGGGLYGWSLMGKRVACTRPRGGNGCWAEYMITDAKMCLALPDTVSL